MSQAMSLDLQVNNKGNAPSATISVLNEFASDAHSKAVKRPAPPWDIIKASIGYGMFEPDFVQSRRHCMSIVTFCDSM
jgi:hypothetical protein